MAKPFVYIASPIQRDPCINTRFQMLIFNSLMDDGFVWPYAPLVSHFQHTVFPRKYEDWIAYDLALIERFDMCLRLTATNSLLGYEQHESSGADGEVAEFIKQGKPVFYSIKQLYDHISVTP